ncbi:hypothetical protein [Nonomuraea sp. PA05]|nr:hypothetical protein [Nonomuraea sp. PA05]
MNAAQILASQAHLTEQDLADFASFLDPEAQERFWADVQAARNTK